jgi:diadenosine tetraphosphatase ApaH/serine/threonine PP2A family protein phosphatase
MPKTSSMGTLEKLMTWLYEVRLWFTRAARLGQLMARGGYLIGERQRLFGKLGELAYEKCQHGGLNPSELEPMVRQIERLTKKLEIEEMLIRSVRFGVKPERPHRHSSGPESAPESAPAGSSPGNATEAR